MDNNSNSVEMKSSKNLFERVRDTIVRVLQVDPETVTPSARFAEDLGADSLHVVEFIMAIEDDFGIEITDSETEKLKRVSDVVDYIKRVQGAE